MKIEDLMTDGKLDIEKIERLNFLSNMNHGVFVENLICAINSQLLTPQETPRERAERELREMGFNSSHNMKRGWFVYVHEGGRGFPEVYIGVNDDGSVQSTQSRYITTTKKVKKYLEALKGE